MKKKAKLFVFSMLIFSIVMAYHIVSSGYLNQTIPTVSDARASVELPILMYHGITEDVSKVNDYTIMLDDFEEDLKWIKANGYTSISASQLVDYVEKGSSLPTKPIMITFDDGYTSNYTLAFPLLQKYNTKAIISVIGLESDINSKDIYKDSYTSNLSWGEIENMSASGLIEFGNHTYALHSITAERKGADKAKGEAQESYSKILTDDLLLNQKKVASATGYPPLVFAWPYGAYPLDGSADDVLKDLGFKVSLTSYQIKNTVEQGNPNSLFGLKRFLRTPDFDINKII